MMLDALAETARAVFGARAVSILVRDGRQLVFTAVAGQGAETMPGERIPADTGMAGWVLAAGQPLVVEDVTEDPRFAAVTPDEAPGLSIEISVLGPLEPIDPHAPGAVVVGRHGLVVEQQDHRGLLLPQVASERGWTVEEFLRQTSIKAGLPPDAWRRDATVSRFTADVFGDD